MQSRPITTVTLQALYTLHFLTITPYCKFILPGQPFVFSDSLFQILKFKKATQIQNFHPFWHNLIPNSFLKKRLFTPPKIKQKYHKIFKRNQKKKITHK